MTTEAQKAEKRNRQVAPHKFYYLRFHHPEIELIDKSNTEEKLGAPSGQRHGEDHKEGGWRLGGVLDEGSNNLDCSRAMRS